MPKPKVADRILRLPAVCETVGLSKPTIHRMYRAKQFPQPVRLGAYSIGWRESQVQAWIAERENNDGGAAFEHRVK